MAFGLTAYSVAVLSFQRYRVTVNPLHVRVSSQPTWCGTGAIICGVWIVAAFSAIPAARSPYWCVTSLLIRLQNIYQHVILFQILVCFFLPLCVIAFSYIMTARHLVKSSTFLSEEAQNPQLNTRKDTAKVLLGLTVVFVISYVPFHIFEIYLFSTLNLENLIPIFRGEIGWYVSVHYTVVVVRYFILFNPCLNPVALFYTSLAFRRHFKRYLTCCCKTKSPPTDFELTGRK
jgi:hypothetical protein